MEAGSPGSASNGTAAFAPPMSDHVIPAIPAVRFAPRADIRPMPAFMSARPNGYPGRKGDTRST
jgi:hypothetical protein